MLSLLPLLSPLLLLLSLLLLLLLSSFFLSPRVNVQRVYICFWVTVFLDVFFALVNVLSCCYYPIAGCCHFNSLSFLFLLVRECAMSVSASRGLIRLVLTLLTGAVMVQERLQVAVTKVTSDGAELNWATTAGQQQDALTCSLHYGPKTEAMLVKTEVHTARSNIKLAHLRPHTTYYAFLNCSRAAVTYNSNTVHFTPRKCCVALRCVMCLCVCVWGRCL